MSSKRSRYNRLITILFSLCLVFSFLGCGGGTSGTGGNDVLARLIEVGGAALANVQVSVLESGEQTVTNAEGQFEVRLPKDKKSTLLFESDLGSAQADVDSTLFPSEEVTIEFVASEDLSVVTVNKIEATNSEGTGDREEEKRPRTRTRKLSGTGSGFAPRVFPILLSVNFIEVADNIGVLSRQLQFTGTIPVGFTVNEERLAAVDFFVRFPDRGKCHLRYQGSDGTNGVFKLSLSISRAADGSMVEESDSAACRNFGSLDVSRGRHITANVSRIKMNGYRSLPIVFAVQMQGK
jgi:hypothetical protein